MLIMDSSTKDDRQLTHAKLMISGFFSDTPLGRTQPVPEKAVSYTTGLNSWVFAPRCLTALACIAFTSPGSYSTLSQPTCLLKPAGELQKSLHGSYSFCSLSILPTQRCLHEFIIQRPVQWP